MCRWSLIAFLAGAMALPASAQPPAHRHGCEYKRTRLPKLRAMATAQELTFFARNCRTHQREPLLD
jgi:hypothetical protein